MTDRAPDAAHEAAATSSSSVAAPSHAAPRLVLADFPPSSAALWVEWLTDAGFDAMPISMDVPTGDHAHGAVAAVLAHTAYPRRDGAAAVRVAKRRWPDAAVLLTSPTLHPGVFSQGTLAQALGAHAVVALPVARETLLSLLKPLVANVAAR